MAVTILRRKALRNQTRSVNRLNKIKDLMRKPEVRNVDVDAIKAEFAEMKKQREAEESGKATKSELRTAQSDKVSESKKAQPKAKEETKAAEEPNAETKSKATEETKEDAKK